MQLQMGTWSDVEAYLEKLRGIIIPIGLIGLIGIPIDA